MRVLLAIPLLLCLPHGAAAQVPVMPASGLVLVLTGASDLRTSVDALPVLRGAGLEVAVVAAPGCYIGRAEQRSMPALRALGGVQGVIEGPVSEEAISALREEQRTGARYLAALQADELETPEALGPMDWSVHPDHALEVPARHKQGAPGAQGFRGGSADVVDWTCGNAYNSETMEGVIVASSFFVESNGSVDPDLYTWTQAHVDQVKLHVIDAWVVWSYTASLYGRTVTAVMDWYEPAGGLTLQGHEPVTRPSTDDQLWIDAILANTGRTEAGAFGKLHAHNRDRRAQLAADRAFSMFIAYNPSAQNAPTQFTDGKIGYAYLGGPYTQLLWRANGWTTSQVNRVYGHEVGHIFHAFDEYTSSGSGNCGRSFNGRQNSNYQGSPCNGTATCVMINNSITGSGATRRWNLCTHTPHHVGWQGVLAPPQPLAPVNDSIVAANPVVLRWSRSGAPTSVFGYVKVYDRSTDDLVYCGYVGQQDTLALPLVNGAYRWVVSLGNSSTGNGYAGVLGQEALFTVNAPLNAAFSRWPATLCAGATVTYTNSATGSPATWSWSFPGGVPTTWSGASPPPVRYLVPGIHAATLVVGDGVGQDTLTLATSVTVTGGLALPVNEPFTGGVPPAGWTVLGSGGVGQGGGGLAWGPFQETACAQDLAAVVPGFGYTGFFAVPTLRSPRIDLTQATAPYLRFKHSYARKDTVVSEALIVTANNCDLSRNFTVYQRSGASLATNGGGVQSAAPWVPQSCGDWSENVVRLDSLKGHVAELSFRFSTPGGGQQVHLDDVQIFEGVCLRSRILLQGALDQGTGLMHDSLRAKGLLPITEPYTDLGQAWVGEGGGETTGPAVLGVTGADAVVDWVVVQVRAPLDPTRVLASRAALLQRDGDVVEVDGVDGVRLPVPAGSYHVAFLHRNHLPICTAQPMALHNAMSVLDLSLPASATWGQDARHIIGSYAALWSGDHRRDQAIRYTGANNDRDAILLRIGGVVPTAVASGYLPEDCTLDGEVRYTGAGNDRDPLLMNIGGSTPTAVRIGQLP